MRSSRVAYAMGAALLVLALVGPAGPEEAPAGRLCLTALDVGQGDALLLEFPEGAPWLIDGGGIPGSRHDVGLARTLPALRARGIDRLGLVVMTHGDADHAAGLFAVLEHLEVDGLLVPRRRGMGATERALVQLAEERGVPVSVAEEGGELPPLGGGVGASVLHPRPGWGGRAGERSTNDGSVVLRVGLGAVQMLLTGDIEAAGEAALVDSGAPLTAAVLKVAHHGSRTSSGEELLAQVQPLVAVGGIGRENRFGFPHQAVVQRLTALGAPLLWTGRHGEVRVCTDGLGLRATGRLDGESVLLREVSPTEIAAWAASAAVRAASASAERGPGALAGAGTGSARRSRPGRGRSSVGESVGATAGKSAGGTASGKKSSARKSSARKSPARKSSSRRSASGKRKASANRAGETAPPRLIDDREWARSRRERKSPRPPWRSRR